MGAKIARLLCLWTLFCGTTRAVQPEPDESGLVPCEIRVQGDCGACNAGLDLNYGQIGETCCDDAVGCCDATPACTNCFGCCGTYGSVDALFWRRNVNSNIPLAIGDGFGLVPTQTIASTADLGFGYEPGVRARLGTRILGSCWAVEGEYLGLYDSNASACAAACQLCPGQILRLPGDLGLVSNVFCGSDSIHTDYWSRLNSMEVNLVKCCESCCASGCGAATQQWFFGFRYINLIETLDIYGARMQDTPQGPLMETAHYGLQTSNDLYGFQAGGRFGIQRGRWGCELLAKSGIYGNAAHQRQHLTDFPAYDLRPQTGADGSSVAFVGELGLTATYQMTRAWSLRGGYGVMWVSGVALAPDQLDYNLNGGQQLATNGSVFYRGFHAGLEAKW